MPINPNIQYTNPFCFARDYLDAQREGDDYIYQDSQLRRDILVTSEELTTLGERLLRVNTREMSSTYAEWCQDYGTVLSTYRGEEIE